MTERGQPSHNDAGESAILGGCIRLLYLWGFEPIRNNTGGFSKKYVNKAGAEITHHIKVGKKGSGDIILCSKKGRYVEIEVKRRRGVQQPEQVARQAYVEANGGLYLLIRSVDDLDGAKELIC